MNDSNIVDLLFRRSDQALKEIKNKYGDYCFCIALNALGSKEDAEECLNDTLFAVWGRIPPEKPDDLKAFVGSIARNISISRYRRENSQKRGGGEIPLALEELSQVISGNGAAVSVGSSLALSSRGDPEEAAIAGDLQYGINDFLKKIPERDCDIFLCRYYYLFPTEEIAKRFGLNRNHVLMILSRTRKKLARHLKEEGYL
ncbi:MAG: sigma-70 family RNA polymerase sigma factor [Firmicutes bacterium]|nr:sigma-70 family RNA polymerase sigma factor [Bacillota bacterium]